MAIHGDHSQLPDYWCQHAMDPQGRLFAEPIEQADKEAALSALDELFESSRAYRTSKQYLEVLRFIKRFPKYSPFNGFLLHMQRPSVSYVATPNQWRKRFSRTIKDGAHPLVILAPMSPVLFVFDAEDTEGNPLPENLIDPFATKGKLATGVWEKTASNLFRDRIKLVEREMERNKAGWISGAATNDYVTQGEQTEKALYLLQINSLLDRGGRYATLAHELGHLYAGHLGTPDERWWPNRNALNHEEREFEAESICYLVCERAGVKNPSDSYLSNYLMKNSEVPSISLDRVLKVAGLIEEMGKQKLKPRKKNE